MFCYLISCDYSQCSFAECTLHLTDLLGFVNEVVHCTQVVKSLDCSQHLKSLKRKDRRSLKYKNQFLKAVESP